MKYLPILKLTMKHDYYESGYSSDFSIVEDKATQQILLNYRCILKRQATGIVIYQTVDSDNKPFINISAKAVFRFHLHLNNTEHALFTDLERFSTVEKNESPVFTNKGLSSSTANPDNELKLITAELQKKDRAFATIEVHINNSIKPELNINEATHYSISFTAKSALWEYYFLTNKDNDGLGNQITYSISQNAEQDNNNQPIIFVEKAPPSQDISRRLLNDYPDTKIVYFVSDKPVHCQQLPRKNIQVSIDGERLMDNLPNPSLNNANQRTVSEAGNTVIQDTFFQIVKYISSASTTRI